ncbi:unnamed protein product (macronuclear) [Paramecium tetraurelia]|uniref:AP180 N-terminal homology (ANTH) domain-containing protein n=1 Tax=Paramecium tetraurelia TaxID=5888 RepID=A0D294_PARTE|nr:uncharacterized protein GSPATT00012667001 [Paramecium tetraurelia]CAK77161.1 unnamed protein product [Paramecium tetraurelia]|eukprot:XP_001444558.1 hypothetical protein (macronuclear) [Paramecium tetraurelia strain d4-2]
MLRKNEDLSKTSQFEDQLQQLMKYDNRNKDQEFLLFSKLCQQKKYLDTVNFIIAYCQVLKDQAYKIIACQGETDSVQGLMTYIESIIYASQMLNLKQSEEFNQFFLFYFKLDASNLKNVEPKIKEMYQSFLPNFDEINQYAQTFAMKKQIMESDLNQSGNQFKINCQQYPQIQQNTSNIGTSSHGNLKIDDQIIQTQPTYDIQTSFINDEKKSFNLNLRTISIKFTQRRNFELQRELL